MLKKEMTLKKEIKMTKLMAAFLATLIFGLPWAAAADKCEGAPIPDSNRYVDPGKRASDPDASSKRRLGLAATDLKCEYAVNPLGVDTLKPRFGWILESLRRGQSQSAYQVQVASSPENLKKDIGDKWDSGKVASDRSVNVEYGGKALSSVEQCWWKVRVWDQNGEVSAWSEPATFEMGLLKQSDWQGEWIGAGKKISAPLLRKEFEIAKDVKHARVHISGLGFCELYVNGRRVSDHVLDPAMTNYHKHVSYVTHDVTDMLTRGQNAIAVMLVTVGTASPAERDTETPPHCLPR